MEYHSGCSSSQEKKNFGSMLKSEKHERSYDDIHPQLLKNSDKLLPKTRGSRYKQQFETKFKREELVLHMSNLPGYLERGGKTQEKAFNVGVLDWRLLQRWQRGHTDVTEPSPRKIPAFFSSEGSSSRQQQRTVRSSVPSHLNASPTNGKKLSDQRITAGTGRMTGSGNRYSGQFCTSDSSKADSLLSVDENQCKISGGYKVNNCRTQFASDYDGPNNFILVTESELDRTSSKDVKNTISKSEVKQDISFPRSASNSPSRKKNLGNMELDYVETNLAGNVVSGVKVELSPSTDMRIPSPTHGFSFGMRRSGQGSSSDTTVSIPSSVPENFSDSKTFRSCDTTGEKSRSKSSPLRRLLDPMLKTKGVDICHERNHSTADRTVKSFSRQREPPASRPLKSKLNMKGCNFVFPQPTEKSGSSIMQALLQVAVKNGVPLFTFTVDNCSDSLAATVKEMSSKKALKRWVYTFFSFSEMKKKNIYWINKGSKDGRNGFIPNVIAQMKVSDASLYSDRRRASSEYNMREFVLSSKDGDQTTSGFLQNEELAAIVVKFPEKLHRELNQQEELQEVRSCLNSRDDREIGFANDGVFSVTVILPGGHHGVPSTGLGEPSPLIERWKTGGSCDCGGWDLGCRLTVLASRNHSNQKSNSTKSQSTITKLFSQEEVEGSKPIFILSPFEDGIFSVQFNSSITLIQAFSIGIAILSSRKMPALPPNILGGKVSEEIILSEKTPAKFSDRKLSAKYAAYPPLSPVGRV